MDAADHEADARALGVGGDEAERGLSLEHRRLGRAEAADLEEVVHDPDRVEADVVGGARHARERRTDRGRAAGPGELVDLKAELHANHLESVDPVGRGGDGFIYCPPRRPSSAWQRFGLWVPNTSGRPPVCVGY